MREKQELRRIKKRYPHLLIHYKRAISELLRLVLGQTDFFIARARQGDKKADAVTFYMPITPAYQRASHNTYLVGTEDDNPVTWSDFRKATPWVALLLGVRDKNGVNRPEFLPNGLTVVDLVNKELAELSDEEYPYESCLRGSQLKLRVDKQIDPTTGKKRTCIKLTLVWDFSL